MIFLATKYSSDLKGYYHKASVCLDRASGIKDASVSIGCNL